MPRFLLVAFFWLVYLVGLVPAHDLWGIGVAAFIAVPLGLTGGLLGMRAGLAVGILQIPLQLFLFGLVTESAIQTMAEQLPGIFLGLLFPIVTGWMHDTFHELRQQIDKRKQAEQTLRENEIRLRRITDNMNDIISELDVQGNLRYASPSHRWVLGIDPEPLLGKPIFENIHPDDAIPAFMVLAETVSTGIAPGPVTFRYRHASGKYLWLECVGSLVRDAQGEITGVVLSSRDITERKQVQDALAQLNTELEERIEHRTAELGRVNADLRREIGEHKIAEQALQSSERRYRAHFENVMDVIYTFDLEFRVTLVSPSVEMVLGYQPKEIIGKHFSELNILAPEYLESAIEDVLMVLNGERVTREYEFIARDGKRLIGEVTGAPLYSENDEINGIVSVARDVTARRRAEEALRASEERYALAARGANDGLWDWHLVTDQIYFSPRWKEMLGYAETSMDGHPQEWFNRVHPDDLRQLQTDLRSHLAGRTNHFENEYRIQSADGNYSWVLCRGLAVRDADGKPTRIAGSQTDITRRKKAEERLVHDALHEPLTGLPNRVLFLDRLSHCLKQTKRNKNYLAAVLFLDLDRFKAINDSLGHLVGDDLLIAVARRLETCLRPTDTVARFGGDEFAILLEDIHSPDDAIRTAERVQAELSESFKMNEHTLVATTSIGIALTRNIVDGNPYEHAEELLRDADTAMYRAKAAGKARYVVFDPGMHLDAMAMLTLEADLRCALERGELMVYYQPVVSLDSRWILSVEALIRWRHPQRGILSPAEFITLTEETGLIVPIGEWILRTACAQTAAWRAAGHADLQIAVNFSARQLQDPNLPSLVKKILAETNLPANALQIEITESTAMQDVAQSQRILRELSEMGIHIAIDDFGNSYSALGNLKRFPFEILKIDRSFVHDIGYDSDVAAIVTAIIEMGHSLKLRVIAEGVESEEQLNFLQSQRCNDVQGYYFSRPVPVEELSKLLSKQSNTANS